MRALSLSQVELAARAELSKSEINALLKGRVHLPGPDKRRRLAKALGVSHLDLLIAAGEITADEVREAGVVGVVERDADPQREALVALIRNATVIPGPWIAGLRAILNPLQPGQAPVDEPSLQSAPNAQ